MWAGGILFLDDQYLTRGQIHPDTWADCKVTPKNTDFVSDFD